MSDPIFLAICACFLAALVMAGWAHHQGQAAPQMDLREKLKNLAKDPEAMAREIELGVEKKSLLEAINLRGFFAKFTGVSYMDHLERELTQCDIPLKPAEFLMVRAGVIVFAGLLGMIMSHNPVIALCVAGVAAFLHIPFLKIKRSMRIDKFVTQLAEFLVLITNSLRSGQTFLQGVDIASKDSPNPIGMEFRLLLKETNLGVPVETAFTNMLVRVPSEDLKIVMSAFSIQRNVGGNLADIMDQVAAMIRQRIAIQGQIKVLTTQGKLSGAIVGLLPIGLGTVIAFINYDYMSKLWTPRHGDNLPLADRYLGPILLGGGIFLELLGCFVIYKICDIEV
jgi:tight adherence protein B